MMVSLRFILTQQGALYVWRRYLSGGVRLVGLEPLFCFPAVVSFGGTVATLHLGGQGYKNSMFSRLDMSAGLTSLSSCGDMFLASRLQVGKHLSKTPFLVSVCPYFVTVNMDAWKYHAVECLFDQPHVVGTMKALVSTDEIDEASIRRRALAHACQHDAHLLPNV